MEALQIYPGTKLCYKLGYKITCLGLKLAVRMLESIFFLLFFYFYLNNHQDLHIFVKDVRFFTHLV